MYQVSVVEELHYACSVLVNGDGLGRHPQQLQQTQSCRLLHLRGRVTARERVANSIHSVHTYTCTWSMECRGFESHPRQLIFSRKSDCLGCAVLLCLVCLFDLACFFLSSFSSLIKNICIYSNIHVHVYMYMDRYMYS